MGDAEYLFNQTSYGAKRLARGAFAKKNGCKSRRCSLPSDKLTPKQLRERNGKVKTYNLSKPMDWKTFKEMDDLLKCSYLEKLVKDYNARCTDLANMFGVNDAYLSTWLKKTAWGKGLIHHTGRRTPTPEWIAFLAGGDSEPSEPSSPEPIQEPVEEPNNEEPVPTRVKLDTQDVVCRNGLLHYIGKPAMIFENAFNTLDKNKDYYISISFLVKEEAIGE